MSALTAVGQYYSMMYVRDGTYLVAPDITSMDNCCAPSPLDDARHSPSLDRAVWRTRPDRRTREQARNHCRVQDSDIVGDNRSSTRATSRSGLALVRLMS